VIFQGALPCRVRVNESLRLVSCIYNKQEQY
jgi:hypothetical protein